MRKRRAALAVIVASTIMIPTIALASNCCGAPKTAKKRWVPEKSEGEESKAKIVEQTTCPFMGGKINKKIYADHDGKRVYFCCKGCVGKFNKNPKKAVKKLEDQGITLATTTKPQTKCPVMHGRMIDKSLFVEHDGKKIYVCCKGCIAKVKADPAKYAKKVAEELKSPEEKDDKKKKNADSGR